jgi:hypothetical protein
MSSERQKETAFLRRCIRYEDSAACRRLEEHIAHAHHNERCLHRARWLVALLGALAITGLAYAAVFEDSFPARMPVFTKLFITNALCALCVGSLISLVAFTVLGHVFRHETNRRREEGRRMVAKFMDSKLGEPRAAHVNQKLTEKTVTAPRSPAPLDRNPSGPLLRAGDPPGS